MPVGGVLECLAGDQQLCAVPTGTDKLEAGRQAASIKAAWERQGAYPGQRPGEIVTVDAIEGLPHVRRGVGQRRREGCRRHGEHIDAIVKQGCHPLPPVLAETKSFGVLHATSITTNRDAIVDVAVHPLWLLLHPLAMQCRRVSHNDHR